MQNLPIETYIQTSMSGVRHFVHQPKGDLRRYVREILWVRSKHPRLQVLLPETSFTLVLRQSGAALLNGEKLSGAVVSGLQQQTRIANHQADSSIIIVRFTEVGAPAILHDRADLFYNRTLALDSVLSLPVVERVQNHLAESRTLRQQILTVEDFLLGQVGPRSRPAAQIEAAASAIRESGGRASIAAVARHCAMSQSSLERHFRTTVGTTPKNLSRLARLQHVCRMWDEGKSLTQIAFDAGYCDQPHMVHDFQLFTGRSPEEFFRNVPGRNLPTFYK